MNSERIFAADGFLISSNNRAQRVMVPEQTLDLITEAGGLEMIEGQTIELIPQIPGQPILPIYDILVAIAPNEPNNN